MSKALISGTQLVPTILRCKRRESALSEFRARFHLQDLTGVLGLAASDKGFAPAPRNRILRDGHKTSFYNTIGGQGQTLERQSCSHFGKDNLMGGPGFVTPARWICDPPPDNCHLPARCRRYPTALLPVARTGKVGLRPASGQLSSAGKMPALAYGFTPSCQNRKE